MWHSSIRQRILGSGGNVLPLSSYALQPAVVTRARSNTVPRSVNFLGFTLTDQQRRVAYNTLIITSLSLSCVFAISGAYAGLYYEESKDADPWMVAVPSILSAGLVVMTYAWGGLLRHGESYGWAFFQPGRGGSQFVTLQAASWFCVGVSLLIPWFPWLMHELMMLHFSPFKMTTSPHHSGALLVVSSAIGVVAQILTVTSLFAYQRPLQSFTWRLLITERADGRSFIYFFMSLQTGLAVYAIVVLFITEHLEDLLVGSAATLAFIWLIAVSTSLTHGVGGPWLKGNEGFTAFQPGRGGKQFVLMQFAGWSTFSLCVAIGIARVVCMFDPDVLPVVKFFATKVLPDGAAALGVLGLFSQIILTLSLFVFEESELEKANRYYRTKRLNEKQAWLNCLTGLPAEVKKEILGYL